MIFDYPHSRSERRHGPTRYTSYKAYLPWLRDEFDFRCIYCLKREQWGQVTGEFEIDHFEPQKLSPERRADYENLVYACRRCNSVKLDQSIADPLVLLSAERIRILPDGMIQARDDETRRLVRQLDLNSPRLQQWRVMWMRIVALAAERDHDLWESLISLPDDLPNLKRFRPPRNTRTEGIGESWFEKRRRGESMLLP